MSETRDGKDVVDVPKVLVDDVRELLSDDEMSNELVEGREFSDQFIAKNLVAIVRDFNVSPPVITQKLSFPALFGEFIDLRPWVTEAAMARTLKYGAIRRMRNNLPYQAGSISYDPNAVGAALLQTADSFLSAWATRRDGYKVNLNVQSGYSVSHSDFLVREIYEHGGIVSVVGGTI
jgi:hypothetical protein